MATSNENSLSGKKWSELGFRDKAAYTTGLLSFVLAFILIFAGFFVDPQGEIDGSVLTGFGTALLYCGGIFGVALYFKQGNNELMTNILNKTEEVIERKFKEKEEEKNADS